ncbi:MAG: hypothetical protein R6U15_00995 [Candidatus Izemoplasmatales bacterium]
MEENKEYIQERANGLENDSSIKIRLDVSEILQEIEFYLRGKEVNYYKNSKTGMVEPTLIQMGKKKLNEVGIKSILAKSRALVNKGVVMGNLTIAQWKEQIMYIRIELIKLLYNNYHNWEIKEDYDIVEITDIIMNTVENLLTRPIDNEERKGFSNIQTTERTVQDSSNGGFKIFGKNND